jgi:hypothetical protein
LTSGSWQTRVINTEVVDADGIVSLSSNQMTLGAGTYRVVARAPGWVIDANRLRIQNVTDGATLLLGQSTPAGFSASPSGSVATVAGEFTLAGSKAIEVQHRCKATKSSDGCGVACSFGVNEVYAEIQIWKIA